MNVSIVHHNPLRGGTYIETPVIIYAKNCTTNVKSEHTDECFLEAVAAALHRNELANNCDATSRSSYEKWISEFDLANIKTPVELTDISKFEKLNDISVCVIGYEEEEIIHDDDDSDDSDVDEDVVSPVSIFPNNDNFAEKFADNLREQKIDIKNNWRLRFRPLYVGAPNKSHSCDLLLIQEGLFKHYIAIHSIDTLLKTPGQAKGSYRAKYCRRCLCSFKTYENLQKHKELCDNFDELNVVPPKKDYEHFENNRAKLPAPFVIYCDFEALHKPITDNKIKLAEQVPVSYGYQIVSTDFERSTLPVARICKNGTAKQMIAELMNEVKNIRWQLSQNVPMSITSEERTQLMKRVACHICKKFVRKPERVVDHCHLTGTIRLENM